jgi:hypothetical protein
MPKCVNVRLSGSKRQVFGRYFRRIDAVLVQGDYELQSIGRMNPVARQSPKATPVSRTPRQSQTAFRSPNLAIKRRPLAV